MERGYIDQLNQTYEMRFANYPAQNCLTINTNQLDYVRNPEHLENVNQRIRQALKLAPFQESLPINL
jgi:deoxyadenosine/deoxycytidine kinase